MDKDNWTLRYFDAEMRYLRRAADEFGQEHPDIAAALNLDKPGGGDPALDRLFQGFAFLMGRLREKIDDDLPEMTAGLVGALCPQYLRMIPSLSVVELSPDIHQMKACEVLGKGFQVRSQPIGPDQIRCIYTTTRDLTLQALQLDAVQLTYEYSGESVIRLRFTRGKLLGWAQMDLRNIPLYLNAGPGLANALHKALTLDARTVYIRQEGSERELAKLYFSPGGFDDKDALWPRGDTEYSGYQQTLEYFTFPEKFMFVTLRGLGRLTLDPASSFFELDLVLRERFPEGFKLDREQIRLHTVPVINLFQREAKPLALAPEQKEYRVRPMRSRDRHAEVYSVDSIWTTNGEAEEHYVPLDIFRSAKDLWREDEPQRHFHSRVKRGASGLHDTWVILGGDGLDVDRVDPEQRLGLQLTVTNGELPRKAVGGCVLDQAVHSTHTSVAVRNLCIPTLPLYPPERDRFHWLLLGHLGSNYLPMLNNAETLRSTLALYDWSGSEWNRKRLDAIVDVGHFLLLSFEKGAPLRGVDIEVTLDSTAFAGTGDICLFGEMLSRFFGLYADIHLYNRLTLILQPGGECHMWPERHSQKVPG